MLQKLLGLLGKEVFEQPPKSTAANLQPLAEVPCRPWLLLWLNYPTTL